MASARNNTSQGRRAALVEQQKRERAAADLVFKLLDVEESARLKTAAAVAKLVGTLGASRAAEVTGLEAREITAYLKLDSEADVPDDLDAVDDDARAADVDDVESDGQGVGAVPAQGGPVPVAVGSGA